MENINTNPDQKDIKPKETGLEEVGAPLEMAEVEEAQKNLEEIDKLPEGEKVKFVEKLKDGLKKIGNITLMAGGAAVALSSLAVFGITVSDIDWSATKALPDSSAIINLTSGLTMIVSALVSAKGLENLKHN